MKVDFIANKEWHKDTLRLIHHNDGRVILRNSTFNYEYNIKDHLGNVRTTFSDSNNDNVITASERRSKNDYYSFGMEHFDASQGSEFKNPENRYLYNGKEMIGEMDWDVLDFGQRLADPALGRFATIDRFSSKYAFQSGYALAGNNPVKYIDVNGDSIIVNEYGKIISNDKKNKLVYLNILNKLIPLGEVGKTINVNVIYSNLLIKNSEEAQDIHNPLTFREKVKGKSEWDLKNNKSYIYGYANDQKTNFLFQGALYSAPDLGNHHFGVVGKAYGYFTEDFMLEQAGRAQMAAGTSLPEWQKYKTEKRPIYSRSGEFISGWKDEKIMLPPYGDDPEDQRMIKEGFKYYQTKIKTKK